MYGLPDKRDGRMTGDHTAIGGRGTGTQISPDGACAAAGAASCARQILPSSSPPRHQVARAYAAAATLSPPLAALWQILHPPCCAAQSSSALHPLSASSPHPRLNFPAVQFPPITSSLLSQG